MNTELAGLPTLSQIQRWQTTHLDVAAGRWNNAATQWEAGYRQMAEGIGTPNGTVWEGDGNRAAQARADRDRAGVEILTERLRAGAQIAVNGGKTIEAAREEALLVIRATNAMGFEVREDLSVIDRTAGLLGAAGLIRQKQAQLLALNVRSGAAQLAAVDQLVSTELDRATAGFDAVDFKQGPIIEPPADNQDGQDFGQCFSENFEEDLGGNMVQGVFVGGALGALRGGVVGILGGPMGVLGGSVVGFVGGAAGGALISGPLRTAATSAWDCV